MLDSSRYASLHPGYWMVFAGIYPSEPEAASRLREAKAVQKGARTQPRRCLSPFVRSGNFGPEFVTRQANRVHSTLEKVVIAPFCRLPPRFRGSENLLMEEHVVYLQSCMYQYSRAIYRSIKDLIDPYTDQQTRLESRRAVLEECELTMSRLAADPQYFARPDRTLFQDIRRYFPITAQAQVAWAVREGVGAAIAFIEQQIEAGAFDGGIARCKATTRKGKACQRTPLPSRDYCPSHQHLEARTSLAA